MPLQIYRLRRILGATAILFTLAVAGMYFYARMKTRNVLKEVPNKIGYDIKQTANGFQFSKSDGKRTLFTVQASAVKEFKLNGRAELHNVNIVLYGRDSSRFDQIYGDDFAFDQKTGDVTAMGEVQIDLISNPAGLGSPDQSTPKEFKNPIHLKTRDLVFNKDTGNAWTSARVEFRTSQASGWADGVKYAGKSNVLTLASNVHVALNGPYQGAINADSGNITNDPRDIVLEHPRLNRDGETLEAERALFQLDSENQVKRMLATGDVTTDIRMGVYKSSTPTRTKKSSLAAAAPELSQEIRSRADEAEILFEGQSLFHTATLKGNVHVEEAGAQPVQGDAGRVILDFGGRNELQKIHALDGAHLMQKASANNSSVNASAKQAQDFDLTAPVIDFTVKQGHVLQYAVTSGPAQIIIAQAQPADGAQATGETSSAATRAPSAQRTIVTAGKFEANFATVGGKNSLVSMHGAPNVRIVNSAPGEPDRVSNSDSVTATFLPQGGIAAITQQGSVAYSDEQPPEKRTQAWAASARYTPSDQMLVLTGNPRIANAGMQTTASTVRINRASGEASAEGDVKTSYSDLKEQVNGALLASSSPIHVTAQHMTARSSAVALYSGNARLWQDANVIEAPLLQFDRDRRTVVADGKSDQPVQTIVVQTEKNVNGAKTASSKGSSPIAITSSRLTYTDSEREIHYEGGVTAKGEDFTASAKAMDAYLLPRSEPSPVQTVPRQGQLDHLIAQGNVVIQQPHRRAEGERLVYTAADSKFVLTGGPPSIFDAEQGKITGVSLTFFRRDDRVLVEGEASSPVVTTTRVAR